MLLLLLEAAAALALVEYVRREFPALGAGAADAARRATRHRDTCELAAIVAETQHRLLSSSPSIRDLSFRLPFRSTTPVSSFTKCSHSRECHFHTVAQSFERELSFVDAEISFSDNARTALDGSPLTGSRTPRSLTSIARR